MISRSSPAGRSPGPLAKVAAAAAVGLAFGIDNPLKAALIIVPAVELAAILPLTPGNVGLASAAVALALGSQGVDSQTALSAGIAFGGVELLTGMAIGAAGALALAGPVGAAVRPRGGRERRDRRCSSRVWRDRPAARGLAGRRPPTAGSWAGPSRPPSVSASAPMTLLSRQTTV